MDVVLGGAQDIASKTVLEASLGRSIKLREDASGSVFEYGGCSAQRRYRLIGRF